MPRAPIDTTGFKKTVLPPAGRDVMLPNAQAPGQFKRKPKSKGKRRSSFGRDMKQRARY